MIYCVSTITNKNNCTFLFLDELPFPCLSTFPVYCLPASNLPSPIQFFISGFPSLISPCSFHSPVSPSTLPSPLFLLSLISRLLLFVSCLLSLTSLVSCLSTRLSTFFHVSLSRKILFRTETIAKTLLCNDVSLKLCFAIDI